MVEPLFNVTVKCTYCENSFETSRVRPSFKKATHTDTDFCVHYKNVNPDFYVVRICPFCGFAATESFSDKWTSDQRADFGEKVASNWTMKEYGKERTWEDALQVYKLALLCAQIKNEKVRVIAGLLHHIAWLHRYKNNWEQEKRFLEFALGAYIGVYETESGSLNNAKLMFLMGELNRRLQRYNEAIKWFGRVINDRKIMDAGMIKASREQWVVTREDMLQAKLELPDEMRQA
ncbi:DUF2225 domain-containing protein [Paenibacillus eucommiae]|uniref:Uncharacterized protein (DUF2225 family) n=1 Tax=Paenibacillus eucommiae TaxID=1355755 RepID=A0ABS4IZR4_9BACL|nr:DUF2225 domain-containing protein [Paenibacillus eucommiae]MBP1993083.1 uncharacterized protein (DUF2225 family) [Paenibacillus eucommiae]